MKRREFIGLIVGTVGAWPFSAQAQSKTYRVALLTLDRGEAASQLIVPLRDLGYVEGKNLNFEHRSADGDPGRLAAMAEELVQAKPDVLVAGWGTLAPKALKTATATIPIVFAAVGDPIGAGLVQTLARPGGNVTGLSGQSTELKGKQLQLLLTCVPGQRAVGVLLNPDTPYSALALKELRAAADREGIRLELLEVRRPPEFTAARMDALVASGALADRFGRRRMLLITVGAGLAVTVLAAASPSYWWFVAIFACGRPLLSASNGLAQVIAAEQTPRASFADALSRRDRLNVIAECKRRSPSRGGSIRSLSMWPSFTRAPTASV